MKHIANILSVALLLSAMALQSQAQVSVRRQSKKETTETSAEKPKKEPRRPAKTSSTERTESAPSARPGSPAAARPERTAPSDTPVRPAANRPDAPVTPTRKATPAKRTGQQAATVADGVTLRQQSFDEYQRDEATEVPWQHVVYRELDLEKGANASLYYPVEPMDGMRNLISVILDAMCKGQLTGYEFLDGREIFTDKYKVKTSDLLDKFQIYYQVKPATKGGQDTYEVDDSDIPSNEVLSYYIKERWEFDQKHGKFRPRVLAVCPVVHRAGDFGGEATRYPMCWFNYEDLRPFLRQHLVMSDGMNNTPRYTMEEFFALEQYEGEIYKVQNLRGQSLMQMYPDSAQLADARVRIDEELRNFGKSIWVDEEAEKAKADAEAAAKAAADSTARAERRAARASREGSHADDNRSSSRRNRRTHEAVDMEAAADAADAKAEEMEERFEKEGAAHSVRRRKR